ncbi:hypothetical protein IFM89_006105 [Coptis chinensis]|uniref:ALBINO3-like protein 2, chloroplastic n=1 Tax=Coptis chinensis TaxID=261450 RepID=A0A835GUL6_9MAGN|nr:hypothetical protein IFM89_006105 [Coptis chinensis]
MPEHFCYGFNRLGVLADKNLKVCLFGHLEQLSLNHPPIPEKLGLPDKISMKSDETTNFGTPDINFSDKEMEHKVSVQNLSPDELFPLSVKVLGKGNKDTAIALLRLALKKDPEYIRALVLLGQALIPLETTEATVYLERAVTKLLHFGHPTKDEDIDLLILASTWAGVTCIPQGKILQGLEHLQRIGQMREPEDPNGKSHYYDGLLVLASALINEGQKDEAAKYLRKATAYDYDRYNIYLQHCLEDSNDVITTSDQKAQ